MKLYLDVYYKSKKTGAYHIFHEIITEEEIERLVKEKTEDCLPMWWTSNEWEYHSTNINKVETNP